MSSSVPGSVPVSFDLISEADMTWKVLGAIDPKNFDYGTPPLPLVKDEVVRLLSGKFPLDDYKDTGGHSQHRYVFEKTDGTRITGILDGFSIGCTFSGASQRQYSNVEVLIPGATQEGIQGTPQGTPQRTTQASHTSNP